MIAICRSFPSGEVTLQASFVTPFIVDYSKRHPWIWALEIFPAWDAYPRNTALRTDLTGGVCRSDSPNDFRSN
jgi:hypothetical protein